MPEVQSTVLVDAEVLRQIEGAWPALRVGGGDLSLGELSAIRDRLQRIVGHLDEIFPPSDAPPVGKRGHRRSVPAVKDDERTLNRLLAECRLFLDQIERTLAPRLPRRSSGTPTDGWRFRGQVRLGKGHGDAIRADYHRLGEEATLGKWCLDVAQYKGGVQGGAGPYTKRQVLAALSHERGGHLRK